MPWRALRLHKPPLIVVDMGTATVFDAVSREGDYLGGAIAPGIGVATDALPGRAAMLRRVELRPPKHGHRQQHHRRDAVRHPLRLRGA